jgi:Putative polyhydroxyalkanoic acid system protein (PHA_gran_rgn)
LLWPAFRNDALGVSLLAWKRTRRAAFEWSTRGNHPAGLFPKYLAKMPNAPLLGREISGSSNERNTTFAVSDVERVTECKLGREETTRQLEGWLRRAAASLPVLQVDEERWDGDRMLFRVRALGQLASGQVDLADDHVGLEVMLPWLLQRFAAAAQTAIRSHGQLLLSKMS